MWPFVKLLCPLVIFCFSIRISPQHSSILVCENTKTGRYTSTETVSVKVYRPTMPSVKELFFTLGVVNPSHSAWSVCLSICHSSEPFSNGSTDRHVVWVEDSGGPKEIMYCYFGFQYSHIAAMQEHPSV